MDAEHGYLCALDATQEPADKLHRSRCVPVSASPWVHLKGDVHFTRGLGVASQWSRLHPPLRESRPLLR